MNVEHEVPPQFPDEKPSPTRLRRRIQRAEVLAAEGDSAAAIAILDDVLPFMPGDVGLLLQLASLHLSERRHGPARALVLQAVQGNLDSPKVALKLFSLLAQLGETRMMVEIAKQLPPAMWDSAKSLSELSQSLNMINASSLAREYARAGVARDPNHPPSLYMLATAELFHGNFAEAARLSLKCLELVPGDPGSLWLLSRLRLPEPEKRIVEIEKELAKFPDAAQETWLAYALHNELHDLKQYDQAWTALQRACKAKRSLLNYRSADNVRLYQSLYSWSAADLSPQDGFVDETLTPIFIVGLHRSGTTLAERVLSGHSLVEAGGETYDITTQLRRASGIHFSGETNAEVVALRNQLDYHRMGEGYLRGIRWRSNGLPYVTDKLPSNYQNIGFIARALPKAKFIHLVRDPIDVGLSNLRTLFHLACPYSYDQLEFADHYHRYIKLMDHWRELLPGRILDVEYAKLVAEPERTAEQMAAFCGLEYQSDMTQIEKRTDSVSTASSVMMRDGIRKDRGQVWKAYEQHLQPMIAALGRSE